MSFPLEGLAIYDTDDRVHRARIMAEYRRQALEELDRIRSFQQLHSLHENPQIDATPARETTPKVPVPVSVPDTALERGVGNGVTDKPLAAASATPHQITQTPRKPTRKVKEIFKRTPKKKTQDDFSDIRRAMGPECLTPHSPTLTRTADPSAGGQLPGEDSWEWYQRNLTALPPMPPLPSPRSAREGSVHPTLREGEQN